MSIWALLLHWMNHAPALPSATEHCLGWQSWGAGAHLRPPCSKMHDNAVSKNWAETVFAVLENITLAWSQSSDQEKRGRHIP